VDFDYVSCLDTRKSITGYIFTVFGTAISWKASLQKVVALSSTEAEYIALTKEAVKKALWLRGIARDSFKIMLSLSIVITKVLFTFQKTRFIT